MKIYSILTVLALSGFSNTIFAAPPTISASVNNKTIVNTVCTPTTCTNIQIVSSSGSHSVELTDVQASALQSDTSVSLTVDGPTVEFALGEDPNFQNGDSSAVIKKEIPVTDGTRLVTMKIKWGNGKLTCTLKDVTSQKQLVPAPLPKIKSEPKATPPAFVTTLIRTPSDTVLNVSAILTCDRKTLVKTTVATNGALVSLINISAKSKSIVEP
jgi:hypothetical protein